MNLLLTGAAGFVGWKTARLLLEAGHEVVGIDNLNDYYDPRLKLWRLRDLGIAEPPTVTGGWAGAGNLRFTRLDIEDRDAVDGLFAANRFDAVINLAARAGVRASIEDPYVYFRTNVDGTVHLLEAMRRHGVGKFVLPSSSSLYAGQAMPFREDLPVNAPISPYAASKKAAETAAYTWHHLYGIDVTILRYFTVYGPAGRPDMSPLRFLKWIDAGEPIQLYGDGSQRRDFTYIDDIAEGTVKALRPVGYEIINLGGGREPVAIKDMIRAFEDHLGKKAVIDFLPFNKADMKETRADAAKARDLLGWHARVGAGEGFRRTAEWYREHADVFRI
ncbi:MAG: NAD-dependent epimerase/dehydratase family protein [Verrucomicrobia bacterium]|jgi:nucleoside-diphosphate-sugar epimerase|nr:NAD-dependent epimerase/dehydratase family protein [Verrucomicrobiota bacterium]